VDTGLYVIKHYFKSPMMYVFSGQAWPIVDRAMGNTMNPAIVPSFRFTFGQEMTFVERMTNAIGSFVMFLHHDYVFIPKMEAKIQEVLKLDHKPDLFDLINRNVEKIIFSR
jgi:hypothetical protein